MRSGFLPVIQWCELIWTFVTRWVDVLFLHGETSAFVARSPWSDPSSPILSPLVARLTWCFPLFHTALCKTTEKYLKCPLHDWALMNLKPWGNAYKHIMPKKKTIDGFMSIREIGTSGLKCFWMVRWSHLKYPILHYHCDGSGI